jgi:ATP-binding cassette subfamily F protein uup
MAPPLLSLQDIRLTFGGAPLLDGVELSVAAGERISLVGRNGSGKSTLLKIAAGLVEADRGVRFVQPGATVRYLPQEPDFSGFATTLAYVEAGLGPGDEAYRARYLLGELGLSGEESPAALSGGEARRAALARVLAPSPDLLLLDEPTNHLDVRAIEWLEGELEAMRSGLVLISHDRRFLETLSRATVWLDRGRTRRLEQGFGAFEAWRDQAFAEEEAARHKLDRKLAAEADWLRYGVTARRKRNVRRLAELHEMRAARKAMRGPAGEARLAAAEAAGSGKLVIEAEHIAKSYGGRPIVRDFSIRIERRDRIGIVGANGAGKTTLLSLLTGALAPDAGTVRLGTNLEIASLEQGRDSLDPAWTLAEALTGGRGDTVVVGGESRHVVSYMGDFLFRPEQARTPIGVLSGGERARVMLARALARPSNLLVLDEPTNDLDLETLDVLEEMLGAYAGTVLLISHDRDFLDRVVSSVIVPEGDGRWQEYAGGYADMLAQRGTDVAAKRLARPEPPKQKPAPGPAAAQRPAARRRLSFNEKHALDRLPGRMAALEAKIAGLRKILEDADLYRRDRSQFDRASADLAAAEAELAAAEEEWLELEMIRQG